MAPKKKNAAKKGNDDWEADLGESIAPPAAGADADDDAAADDDAPSGGGGLMNLMRKNREKRKKRGLGEDFVDGETAPGADETPAEPTPGLTTKAAEEADLDDEFALPDKKGKGKQAAQKAALSAPKPKETEAEVDDLEASGRVLTKAEKEKLKKEREKQRKKEQVSWAPRMHIRVDSGC